jgi:hypothetical protein
MAASYAVGNTSLYYRYTRSRELAASWLGNARFECVGLVTSVNGETTDQRDIV